MSPTVDTNLVKSLMNIMECLLAKTLDARPAAGTSRASTSGAAAAASNKRRSAAGGGDDPASAAASAARALEGASLQATPLRRQHIECSFMFALVWSLGCSGDEASQAKWAAFLTQVMRCSTPDHAHGWVKRGA
jgi:Dynein heavy chain AAA lid domain